MAHLILHPLPGSKRAGELCKLVNRLAGEGRSVIVWVADEGRRQILDDYFWTFDKYAFLPHVIWTSGMDRPIEPVVIVGEPANPTDAPVLVVGDDPPPVEWAQQFEEIHDFIPPGEAGEERTRHWREAGLLD